jgi:hypothetical protein
VRETKQKENVMKFPKLLTRFRFRGFQVRVYRNTSPYLLGKTKKNLWFGPVMVRVEQGV